MPVEAECACLRAETLVSVCRLRRVLGAEEGRGEGYSQFVNQDADGLWQARFMRVSAGCAAQRVELVPVRGHVCQDGVCEWSRVCRHGDRRLIYSAPDETD